MKKQISQDAAREAVAVLDKLVASNDSIKKVVEKAVLCAEKMTNDEHKREKYASRMIIMHYSNLVAAGGGASAIPGLIPFVGPILSIFGVAALDAIIALKFELEMTLALSPDSISTTNANEKSTSYSFAPRSKKHTTTTKSLLSKISSTSP